MRKVLVLYMLVELLAAGFHGWASYGWFGWLAADLDDFTGSPDALLLYRQNQANYLQSQGFLMGLLPGGVAIAFLTIVRQAAGMSIRVRLLQISLVLLPIAAFVVACFLTPT